MRRGYEGEHHVFASANEVRAEAFHIFFFACLLAGESADVFCLLRSVVSSIHVRVFHFPARWEGGRGYDSTLYYFFVSGNSCFDGDFMGFFRGFHFSP